MSLTDNAGRVHRPALVVSQDLPQSFRDLLIVGRLQV